MPMLGFCRLDPHISIPRLAGSSPENGSTLTAQDLMLSPGVTCWPMWANIAVPGSMDTQLVLDIKEKAREWSCSHLGLIRCIDECNWTFSAGWKIPSGVQLLPSILISGSSIFWCAMEGLQGWLFLTAELCRRHYFAHLHDGLSSILWVKASAGSERDVVETLCKSMVLKGMTWGRQSSSSVCLRADRIGKHVC